VTGTIGESNHQDLHRKIINGIDAELAIAAEYIPFVVERREQDGAVWKLFVDLAETRTSGLDESLEGSPAWWAGPPKGGADILSVIPEEQQINLRFATSMPPGPDGRFLVYPPRYLEALRMVWSDRDWARRSLDWLDHIRNANSCDRNKMPVPSPFQHRLRPRQAEAFQLAGWDAAFLWGPPGTGKTYTLGAMLAQYLVQFPAARVLLLSTTNSAVDQALVSVDKAMGMLLDRHPAGGGRTRPRCLRVGNHFIASNYKGREYVESRRPDVGDVRAYNDWKLLVEQFRKAIRQQSSDALASARLAAMTTTRAVFTLDEVRAVAPYDLIVFDEASQVGLAHALSLAPLGRHVLFAGDPQQLSPIVQSEHPDAMECLGDSMFVHMARASASTGLLNEQSRMAEPICSIISNVFYDGQLVVAADCQKDPQWHRERELASVWPMNRSPVHLETIEQDGAYSQNYQGPIRQPGAVFACEVVERLIQQGTEEQDIIILTPFRAQRALIRQKLRQAHLRHVTVSTVHRSQGSERHTVIFDPTDGGNEFLNPR